MPRSLIGKKRPGVDLARMREAVTAVLADDGTKISLREAARSFKVSKSSLSRSIKEFKEKGYLGVR